MPRPPQKTIVFNSKQFKFHDYRLCSCSIPMGDDGVLPDIAVLSDESDPPDQPPQQPKRAKKTKDKDVNVPLPLDSEVRLRAILARPQCACKKSNCYQKFTPVEEFQRFQEFRTEWHGFHKLDQDRIVAWFGFGHCCDFHWFPKTRKPQRCFSLSRASL